MQQKSEFKPYFIIGYPRSGTTLLLHFLMSSGCFPKYQFSESHFFSHYYRRYGSLKNEKNLTIFQKEIFGSAWFNDSGVRPEKVMQRLQGQKIDYANLFVSIMEEISSIQGYDRWLEKTPWHILYTREIKKHIPNSKFILIIRDPRDVALSIFNYGWSKGFFAGPVRAAIAWAWHMKNLMKNLSLNSDDVLIIKYEDLVENAERAAMSIAEFLETNIDYDTIINNPIGVMKSSNTSYKSDINSNPVNRWKSLKDENLIRKLDCAVGKELETFGYRLSGFTPLNYSDQLRIKGFKLLYSIAKQSRQIIFPIVRR
ncbi:MAG: sulfotransferase [Gammaproteobacteria bacterium]|nr:sulfotransferase [Gammaproteobacteria bacterium]